MTRASFRQADLERIFRAAKKVGSHVQIDLRNLVVTVYPTPDKGGDHLTGFAPDGPENWDDEEVEEIRL